MGGRGKKKKKKKRQGKTALRAPTIFEFPLTAPALTFAPRSDLFGHQRSPLQPLSALSAHVKTSPLHALMLFSALRSSDFPREKGYVSSSLKMERPFVNMRSCLTEPLSPSLPLCASHSHSKNHKNPNNNPKIPKYYKLCMPLGKIKTSQKSEEKSQNPKKIPIIPIIEKKSKTF